MSQMNVNQSIDDQERARELWELGVQHLMQGDLQCAVDCFNESLAVYPTARTFLEIIQP